MRPVYTCSIRASAVHNVSFFICPFVPWHSNFALANHVNTFSFLRTDDDDPFPRFWKTSFCIFWGWEIPGNAAYTRPPLLGGRWNAVPKMSNSLDVLGSTSHTPWWLLMARLIGLISLPNNLAYKHTVTLQNIFRRSEVQRGSVSS